MKIKLSDPNELIEVKFEGTTIMTRENYTKFAHLLGKSINELSKSTDISRYSICSNNLKTTPCNKYKAGRVFKIKDEKDIYWFVTYVEDLVYGWIITKDQFNCLVNCNVFDLDLLLSGILRRIRNWHYDESGLINYKGENKDDNFELVYEFSEEFVFRIIPIIKERI